MTTEVSQCRLVLSRPTMAAGALDDPTCTARVPSEHQYVPTGSIVQPIIVALQVAQLMYVLGHDTNPPGLVPLISIWDLLLAL